MSPILRKYGESATINFVVYEVDGIDLRTDAVYASGDVKIMRDEAAEANTTNGFTDEGLGYSIVLTATEMQAERIVLYFVDQTATKVWLDTSVIIETYGNASAQHAFDLDTASVAQTGDNYARLGAPSGASVSADIAVIDGNVDSILVDTGTTIPGQISGLNDISAAQVNAEVDTALADIHLDHLLAADYDPATPPGVATALLNELVESDAGVSRFTVNALENGPSGSGASAAAIADAVWDEAQGGHTTVGTFGEFLDAAVSGVGGGLTQQNVRDAMKLSPTAGSPAAGSVDEHLDNIESDTNELQSDDVPGLIAALNDIAATEIVSSGAITTLAGAVVNVDTVDTTTTNTDMRGTDNALLAASYTAPDNAGITANGVAIGSLNDISAAEVTADLTANFASLDATRYKKNTASQKLFFTLVSSANHVVRQTGITPSGAVSINGAASVAVTGTIVEVGSGVYYLDTSAADVNGDDLVYFFNGAGCDPVEIAVTTY